MQGGKDLCTWVCVPALPPTELIFGYGVMTGASILFNSRRPPGHRANRNSLQMIKYRLDFGLCVCLCAPVCVCVWFSSISISFPSAAPMMQLIIKIEATRVSALPPPTAVIYWAHSSK